MQTDTLNRGTPTVETGSRSSEETKHGFMEKVTQVATTVKSRRRSFTGRLLHPRRGRSNSIDPSKASPALPLEIVEKIVAYLNQFDLIKVSRVSRDCYTICEKYLYFRPFTRRYDKLLRTLQKYPYKGRMIIELALGLETDFWAVKQPPYDREWVYTEILRLTPNLEQFIFQGWLIWSSQANNAMVGRHAYVWAMPTRVRDVVVTPDVFESIPTTFLRHLQFRRLASSFNEICQVVQRSEHLETLILYELGSLDELHLEKLIDSPVASTLRTLRIRFLPTPTPMDKDHGALLSKILPKLQALTNLILEVSTLHDQPFFESFAFSCRQVWNLTLGYSNEVTKEGLQMLGRHGELRKFEITPGLKFDLETLKTIVYGNPNLVELILPKESVTDESRKSLVELKGSVNHLYIKPHSREFELFLRQRLGGRQPPIVRFM